MQALQDSFDHLRRRALQVGILNAQNQSSAKMTGKEPVEKRSAGASYMQIAGRGGSKADAELFRGVRLGGWSIAHSFVTNLDVTAHPN